MVATNDNNVYVGNVNNETSTSMTATTISSQSGICVPVSNASSSSAVAAAAAASSSVRQVIELETENVQLRKELQAQREGFEKKVKE